ncbi:predicted protein [Uncinocarpus reesii 1704]|uniref:Phytocyanin domain-containing protein n=1 Tax=Uncinocarpus reesii (strain UAMH 1704) TaxID=336963 RepID=C4JV87_UNCRE|nr:uncharacterized protein UREG_06479 [Uncinocarpus reesii 1704]EEP81614.1 predicted protein [Uncinocarpus reesii 1704]
MLNRLLARLALLPIALQLVVLTAAQRTGNPVPTATHSPRPTRTATGTRTNTRTRTSSRTASATHTVKVGHKVDPHQYVPRTVNAKVGDVIVFEFFPRNHSVVQADYLAPCVPASGDFFYSGIFNSFHESDGVLVGGPKFFYCTALGSCIDNGMVGVINPNRTMTWAEQYAKALKYPYMLVPGESPPAEGTPGTPSSTPSPAPSSSGLGGGAIAGIVIGSVAGIAVLGLLFFLLGRNRVYRKWLTSEEGSNDRTRRWAMSGGDWSTSGRTEKDGAAPTPQPGHASMLSPDMSRFSGPYNPTLQSRSPPPGHLSWDGLGVYQPPGMMQEERPPELSSGAGVQLVELEASPRRHQSKEYIPPADH